MRAMALMLGHSPATASRELARNCGLGYYASVPAQALSVARRLAARRPAKLDPQGVTWRIVLTLLYWKWSPQQISGALKRMCPNDSSQQVSHETIYARPYGQLRCQLVACLRNHRTDRVPRSQGTDRGGQIPDTPSIHVRPPEVDDRVMPVAGSSAKLNSIAAPLRQSFTYDQGKEMACHQELAATTGVKVHCCDPHSPWQRGTCENTNGLLRQYLPKGTDLSVYSQDDLDAIADNLNGRSRATHAFHSPFEVFATMLALASRLNTSIH